VRDSDLWLTFVAGTVVSSAAFNVDTGVLEITLESMTTGASERPPEPLSLASVLPSIISDPQGLLTVPLAKSNVVLLGTVGDTITVKLALDSLAQLQHYFSIEDVPELSFISDRSGSSSVPLTFACLPCLTTSPLSVSHP
jgi:hypothetical protein